MDALLRPGMRLMRRLGVTGKFITIGLLLLIPLLVSVAGGWSAGSRDITFAQRERDGLRLTVPLVHLVAVLADVQADRALGADGQQDQDRLRVVVAEVDTAEAAVGARLGVHSGWVRLRGEVLRPGSATALHQAQEFVAQVTDASCLMLDPGSSLDTLLARRQAERSGQRLGDLAHFGDLADPDG